MFSTHFVWIRVWFPSFLSRCSSRKGIANRIACSRSRYSSVLFLIFILFPLFSCILLLLFAWSKSSQKIKSSRLGSAETGRSRSGKISLGQHCEKASLRSEMQALFACCHPIEIFLILTSAVRRFSLLPRSVPINDASLPYSFSFCFSFSFCILLLYYHATFCLIKK